jgi:alpha-tubulin suppressor-like RCC1 family protein
VGDGDDWAAVAAGSYHSLAIKKDGSLWAWGYNSYGHLGLGDMVDRNTPQPVPGGDVWASVSAGQQHTMAIKANGSLWTCGANSYGQLGDGTSDERHSFVPVMAGATDWAAVAAGAFHTLAVRDGGDVYAWGRNIFGAVGDGSSDDRNLPVKIGEGYRVPAK